MTTRLLSRAWLRRYALALGGLLGAGAAAQAQSLNYTTGNATNAAGTFTSIASTGTAITPANTDNANSAATDIGFTFGFNGQSFTQFILNTNGFIKLGSTAPSSASLFFTPETTIAGDVFSSTNSADVNIIAPFNCDLESSATAATYQVQTTGTAGSRICTIQWTNVRDKQITNAPQYTSFSFQVKLYEGTNRVELIYNVPTAGTGTDALRYSGAGIKGSGTATGQVLTFTKTSATPWSSATVQGTIYSANTLNYRQTVLPDAGRTFRFVPTAANDAGVATFTYGKIATPGALPHAVQALVTNTGSTALTNVVATLSVTGANTFSDTKTVASLAVGASSLVTFASYPATLTAGTNTVTVSIPSDGNNTNNSSVYSQQVTTSRVSYIDPNGTLNATGVGVGQAGGALVAKYTLPAASYISDVALTFAASAGNTSTYQVLLYDATGANGVPGSVLYTSATQTRTAAAGTTTVTIPSIAVPATFYIGVKELSTNPALAYQVEDPLKPDTYYYSLDAATGWTSVNTTTLRTRLAIEFGLTSAPTCAAPTALAAGTVTSSTANLTFTPAAGAVNYTLTYTPAGGTTITQTVTGSPISLTNLTPSTTYTVSLVTNCGGTNGSSAAATTTFTTPAVAPANNECATATTLTPGSTCTPTSGTTVGATQSLAAITCNGYTGTADDDVWYKFVATATGHTVTVAGNTGFDPVVDVRSGACPGVNIGCADATFSGGTEIVSLSNLTVGSTYYVRVYSYGNGGTTPGTFTICVTGALVCAAVTNAAVTPVSSTATYAAAQLSFTAASGASGYYVTLNQTGSTTAPATGTITASPITLSGLTPNTSYTVTITTNCTNGGTSSTVTVVFTSPAASTATPPANNECAGATTLTVAPTCTPITGTTVGATQSLAAIVCATFTGEADDDVWYKFTATATSHTVTVAGNGSFDAVVDVRSGACPGVNIGCADATGLGQTETATLTGLTVGNTYYVRVYDYDAGVTGTFTICVTGPAAGCAAVTGLAAGSVTATGATLSYTAASGATSYTITYTPAGGTAQTITSTASPVTLTGLAPGTRYTVGVTTNCGGGQTSTAATTVFTTLAPAPASASAGTITATSATITFGTVTGATTYTVTYTPASGPAQTVTVTTSPAVLTGLTPNTAYTVTVVANYPSTASSAVSTTFTTLQGLAVRSALAGGNLVVFPNPAHHSFTLSLPAIGGSTARLELVNALGQTVRRHTIALTAGGTRTPVDVTGLATGIYTVRVQAGSETATTRLILE